MVFSVRFEACGCAETQECGADANGSASGNASAPGSLWDRQRAAVPACRLRGSEFFTACFAVPLPARRVLHTGHPKDANSLGSLFGMSNPICYFRLLYTTLGEHGVGGVASYALVVGWVATAHPSVSVYRSMWADLKNALQSDLSSLIDNQSLCRILPDCLNY
ncbi:MAG: hypothetical protein JWR15_3471 [Prosthecobacter sp.]|nr:hypothetical protein [Prosthecobacter sp.]